jgi:hypothetical protein
MGEEKASADN